MSDWEKYAAEEYEILVAEEGANEQEEMQVYRIITVSSFITKIYILILCVFSLSEYVY